MSISSAQALSTARIGEGITDILTTHKRPKAVYVGVNADWQFYLDSYPSGAAWVSFTAVQKGSILPIRPTGVKDGEGNPPSAGDIVFLS